MNIWKISLKNLKSKPLYTFLSVFILALSIALLLGVQQLKSSFKHQINNNLGEIDLVIGAKGSPLQLVLASVLHLDNPTGNISYEQAKKIGKNRMIKSAVPISYGDNYKGFRIVGTTPQFLSIYNAELQKGRFVKKSMEVVLGNSVAKKLNLKINDTFLSSHGLVDNDIHIHEEKLTVVGILKPTQKVIDRLIISNLESVWEVHHHEEHHHHEDEKDEHHHKENHSEESQLKHHPKKKNTHFHEGVAHSHSEESHQHHQHQKEKTEKKQTKKPDNNKEITSLLIRFRNPTALLTLPRKINKDTNMQAALPKYELDKLYEYTGIGLKTISWIAYLILIISGITIFISLYKMVKERAFDLALLRTYGASNFQLIKMVIYEALFIGIIAFITGFLFTKILLNFMLTFARNEHQQSMLQKLKFQEVLQTGSLVFMMIILAVLLAIYPIIKMNISTILSDEK